MTRRRRHGGLAYNGGHLRVGVVIPRGGFAARKGRSRYASMRITTIGEQRADRGVVPGPGPRCSRHTLLLMPAVECAGRRFPARGIAIATAPQGMQALRNGPTDDARKRGLNYATAANPSATFGQLTTFHHASR
jgi:hypothetical protein